MPTRESFVLALVAVVFAVLTTGCEGNPGETLSLVGGFFVVVTILFIVLAVVLARMRAKLRAVVAALPGFKPSREKAGQDGATGILVDERSRKVCLTLTGPPPVARLVEYKDLLGAEILEDGESTIKTVRSSQVAGAVVGGLLLGPVGLLAGALTAGKKSTNKVHSVDLKILVNDAARPVHMVKFLKGDWDRTSFMYKHAIAEAREWHGLMMVLIQQADKDAPTSSPGPVPSPSSSPSSPSVADELAKLADLRDRGVLSPSEFEQQKALLLGRRG